MSSIANKAPTLGRMPHQILLLCSCSVAVTSTARSANTHCAAGAIATVQTAGNCLEVISAQYDSIDCGDARHTTGGDSELEGQYVSSLVAISAS